MRKDIKQNISSNEVKNGLENSPKCKTAYLPTMQS